LHRRNKPPITLNILVVTMMNLEFHRAELPSTLVPCSQTVSSVTYCQESQSVGFIYELIVTLPTNVVLCIIQRRVVEMLDTEGSSHTVFQICTQVSRQFNFCCKETLIQYMLQCRRLKTAIWSIIYGNDQLKT
jgi:hypothetical protein